MRPNLLILFCAVAGFVGSCVDRHLSGHIREQRAAERRPAPTPPPIIQPQSVVTAAAELDERVSRWALAHEFRRGYYTPAPRGGRR